MEHKLDCFDCLQITDMNNVSFNSSNEELTWKCFTHGFCSCYLWNILENKGKIIDNFSFTGCGYCKIV